MRMTRGRGGRHKEGMWLRNSTTVYSISNEIIIFVGRFPPLPALLFLRIVAVNIDNEEESRSLEGKNNNDDGGADSNNNNSSYYTN